MSSCWLRVAQASAGVGWGQQWIPRIGHEVIVNYLDGDMDQPIITGSVYNRDNMPPWIGSNDSAATASQKATQSGIKTRSTPNGGPENYNELRFEDKKGHEAIHLHAERNLETSVESCETHAVGVNQTMAVGEDRKITVGRHESKKVSGRQDLHVVGPSVTNCDSDRFLTVKGVDYSTVDAKQINVGGSFVVGAGDITLQATTRIKLVVGENSITIDKQGVTVIGLPLIALNPVQTIGQLMGQIAAEQGDIMAEKPVEQVVTEQVAEIVTKKIVGQIASHQVHEIRAKIEAEHADEIAAKQQAIETLNNAI